MGVDFSQVSPHPELSFADCNLRYASLVKINLRKTHFLRCVAREANFLDADLTDSDFSGTELTGSNFQGCTLWNTDFRRATGLFFEPARNKVKKTRVPVETAVLLALSLGLLVDGYPS